jgi:hypothetical protein
MSRWAICHLQQLYIAGTKAGGNLTHGSRVDLDAEVSPGVTYAQALGGDEGPYLKHFTLEGAVPVRAPEPAGKPADSTKDA